MRAAILVAIFLPTLFAIFLPLITSGKRWRADQESRANAVCQSIGECNTPETRHLTGIQRSPIAMSGLFPVFWHHLHSLASSGRLYSISTQKRTSGRRSAQL